MCALTSSSLMPGWPGSGPAEVPVVVDCAASGRQPPRALLFEIDNVLHDATLWQRWFWQLLSRLGMQRDFHSFCTIWQRGYMQAVHSGTRDFAAALRSFLVDCGLSAGQIDEVEAASSARRREFCENVRPLPGVLKTLSELSGAGVALGVLANSEFGGSELRERTQRLGLARHFQFVFSSRDLGHAKPAAACYQAALDWLRMPSHAVAVVSSESDDLAGAAALGLKTIAVHAGTEAAADYPLQHFDELLTVCLPGRQPQPAPNC